MIQRIVTSLILALPVAFSLFMGGWILLILLTILAFAMAREWMTLFDNPYPRASAIGLGATVMVFFLTAQIMGTASIAAILLVGISLLYAVGQFIWQRRLVLASGVLYIGIPCLAAFWMRHSEPHGIWLIYYIVFMVVSIDVFALIFGKILGGPRFMPSISPQKTWAGLLGGWVGSSLTSIIFYMIMRSVDIIYPLASYLIWPLILTIVAQAGDLYESAVKRKYGVKDTGSILPGHGGILDRVDGMVFVLIFLALVAIIRGAYTARSPAQAIWGW